jgi:hypothetical protein
MRGFLHDAPCDTDRIDDPDNCCDGARTSRLAVHDGRVQFDIACRIRRRTSPGNVQTTVLHLSYRELDDVERAAASCQADLTFLSQVAQMTFNDGIVPAGNGAGTAMQC